MSRSRGISTRCGTPADPIVSAIRGALAYPSAPLNRYALDINTLRGLYFGRNDAAAWSGGAVEDANAAAALTILVGADADGLNPAAYRLDAIVSRQQNGSPAAPA